MQEHHNHQMLVVIHTPFQSLYTDVIPMELNVSIENLIIWHQIDLKYIVVKVDL